MKVDLHKLSEMLLRPHFVPSPKDLRRDSGVFWVGSALPPRQTLETVFESVCVEPAELFCLTFERPADFRQGEELVRLLKKNFSGFLLGRFQHLPSPALLDLAYAAGIDLVDIPLLPGGIAANGEIVAGLAHALTVFPRWAVVSTLPAEDATETAIHTANDLLARDILPLASLAGRAGQDAEEVARLFQHLAKGWHRAGAMLKPLRPLLDLTTPLLTPPPRRGLGTLLDRVETAKLRTASDLRRLLRVRQVEVSFESAGL